MEAAGYIELVPVDDDALDSAFAADVADIKIFSSLHLRCGNFAPLIRNENF